MSEEEKTKQDSENTVTEIVLDDREIDFNAASKRAREFTESHESSYLQKPRCQTQRSQLLLVCAENLSDDFIQTIFDGPQLSAVTIDFLHFIALLVDEDFVRRFYGKRSTVSDVNDALLEYFAGSRFPKEVEFRERLTKEVDKVRKSYEAEIGFLKKERKSVKKSFRESEKKQAELDAVRKEASEKDVKLAIADKDKEIQKLTMELETCKKERDEALKNRDEAMKKLESAGTESDKSKPEESPKSEPYSNHEASFGRIKNSRKNTKRSEVLINAISDGEHSKEQYDVISDAYQKGMSCKNLIRLSDARISAGNLKVLENLLLRNEFGSRMRRD